MERYIYYEDTANKVFYAPINLSHITTMAFRENREQSEWELIFLTNGNKNVTWVFKDPNEGGETYQNVIRVLTDGTQAINVKPDSTS